MERVGVGGGGILNRLVQAFPGRPVVKTALPLQGVRARYLVREVPHAKKWPKEKKKVYCRLTS